MHTAVWVHHVSQDTHIHMYVLVQELTIAEFTHKYIRPLSNIIIVYYVSGCLSTLCK